MSRTLEMGREITRLQGRLARVEADLAAKDAELQHLLAAPSSEPTREVIEAALLRVAQNVAKHCEIRSGWHAADECFECDLRQAEAELMALVAAKDRVLLDVAERLYAAFEVIAARAGAGWKRTPEYQDGGGV